METPAQQLALSGPALDEGELADLDRLCVKKRPALSSLLRRSVPARGEGIPFSFGDLLEHFSKTCENRHNHSAIETLSNFMAQPREATWYCVGCVSRRRNDGKSTLGQDGLCLVCRNQVLRRVQFKPLGQDPETKYLVRMVEWPSQ